MNLQNNGYQYVRNKAGKNPMEGPVEQGINEYPLLRRMRENYRFLAA